MRLEGDTCCSAYCKSGFICDEDSACEFFCVTGTVFGEVGGTTVAPRIVNQVSYVMRIQHVNLSA